MSAPALSILTPCFRQPEWLPLCVASVVMQGVAGVEQVVVDGGSDDGTADYLASSPGCVGPWISEPDDGQSDALNKALELATGEWLWWQNADDYFLPGAIALAFEVAAAHPDVEVVLGDTILADEQGRSLGAIAHAPVSADRWLEGFWPYNQGVMIKRSLIEAVGGWDVDLHLHMDTDLFARIALERPRIAYLDLPLGAFRQQAQAKTTGGEFDPASVRERALLEARYGRRLWPRPGLARQLHRLRFHALRLAGFGPSSLLRRAGDRASRITPSVQR